MAELEPALAEDRRALEAFVARARAVPSDRWQGPRGPGKWSAAQVCEHVAVTYEKACATLRGESQKGMPRWARPLIRMLFLGRVLKTGKFPKGSKTPPAFEPSASPPAFAETARRLETAAQDFAAEARRRGGPGATIDHPVFGRIRVVDYVRLNALHTAHHENQLP